MFPFMPLPFFPMWEDEENEEKPANVELTGGELKQLSELAWLARREHLKHALLGETEHGASIEWVRTDEDSVTGIRTCHFRYGFQLARGRDDKKSSTPRSFIYRNEAPPAVLLLNTMDVTLKAHTDEKRTAAEIMKQQGQDAVWVQYRVELELYDAKPLVDKIEAARKQLDADRIKAREEQQKQREARYEEAAKNPPWVVARELKQSMDNLTAGLQNLNKLADALKTEADRRRA